jgi:hypothetical protein
MKFTSTQVLYKAQLGNPNYTDFAKGRQFAAIGRELLPALATETGYVVLKITKHQATSPSRQDTVDCTYTFDYQHITDAEYLETLARHSSHEAINGYYPDRKV